MKHWKKLLSLVLALCMVASMIVMPVSAATEDAEPTEPTVPVEPEAPAGGTYTKVTDVSQFTTGKYVLIAPNGYAPTVYENGWILTGALSAESDTIIPEAEYVWDITVTDGSAVLTDSNGVSIAPKGDNDNGVNAGEYSWAWAFENGTFTFSGVDRDTVTLACNTDSANRFRGYKNTTVATGNYPYEFTLYKLERAMAAKRAPVRILSSSAVRRCLLWRKCLPSARRSSILP